MGTKSPFPHQFYLEYQVPRSSFLMRCHQQLPGLSYVLSFRRACFFQIQVFFFLLFDSHFGPAAELRYYRVLLYPGLGIRSVDFRTDWFVHRSRTCARKHKRLRSRQRFQSRARRLKRFRFQCRGFSSRNVPDKGL